MSFSVFRDRPSSMCGLCSPTIFCGRYDVEATLMGGPDLNSLSLATWELRRTFQIWELSIRIIHEHRGTYTTTALLRTYIDAHNRTSEPLFRTDDLYGAILLRYTSFRTECEIAETALPLQPGTLPPCPAVRTIIDWPLTFGRHLS